MWWQWVNISLQIGEGTTSDFISVLIPVRNEAENIKKLILSIQEGNRPSDHFEILVIDDHSTDATTEIVMSLQTSYSNLHFTHLPYGREGKKEAITYGVEKAKGDWVVCTDGDSTVGVNWLEMHNQACQQGAVMAFGPVKLINPSGRIWVDLLNLELAALVTVGAATLRMGKPTMINGCNYSFSKKAFQKVGGYSGNEQIASGDDEFLLRKMNKVFPDKIQFLKTEEALVQSQAPKNWTEFYHQRRRWASKWKHHRDLVSWVTPIFLFVCYAIWSWMAVEVFRASSCLGITMLILKMVVDYVFIRNAGSIQSLQVSPFSFLLLQIIYPVYVVFFGVASNFGRYSWRERTHKI